MNKNAEEGIAGSLWINGRNTPTTMIWVSDTHAELVLHEDVVLAGSQLTALVVRSFLSLPMRLEVQTGQHIVLRFVQRPHASVIELMRRDLLEAGIAAARDAAEESALGPVAMLELVRAIDQQAAGQLQHRAQAA